MGGQGLAMPCVAKKKKIGLPAWPPKMGCHTPLGCQNGWPGLALKKKFVFVARGWPPILGGQTPPGLHKKKKVFKCFEKKMGFSKIMFGQVVGPIYAKVDFI